MVCVSQTDRLGRLRPAELRRVRSEIATGPRTLERASRERDLEMADQRLMLSPTHRQVELPQEGRQGCQKRIEAVFCWIKSSAGRAKVKLRGREPVDAALTLALMVYNLIRLPKLLAPT